MLQAAGALFAFGLLLPAGVAAQTTPKAKCLAGVAPWVRVRVRHGVVADDAVNSPITQKAIAPVTLPCHLQVFVLVQVSTFRGLSPYHSLTTLPLAFTLAPLDPGFVYLGPDIPNANACRCSSVYYSLLSACADCQDREWIKCGLSTLLRLTSI